MMRRIANKKLLLILIPIVMIILFMILSIKREEVITKGMIIDKTEIQNFESEKKFKKINFKYEIKGDNSINLNIYNPNGELEDSGVISLDNSYNKEFDNIKGEWKVELTPNNNKETTVQSEVVKTK